MASTITQPVSSRLRPQDIDALRVQASRDGATISATIARLVAEHVTRPATAGT